MEETAHILLNKASWTGHDLYDLSQGNTLMRAQLHTR
jgi:hypothetical protein